MIMRGQEPSTCCPLVRAAGLDSNPASDWPTPAAQQRQPLMNWNVKAQERVCVTPTVVSPFVPVLCPLHVCSECVCAH